jgi:hypothetical protein
MKQIARSLMILSMFFHQFCFADSEGSVQQKKSITDAKGKKITVIDFNDSVIEGKAKAPDGFVLQSRQGGHFRSILSLRKNFRPQISGSSSQAQVRNP